MRKIPIQLIILPALVFQFIGAYFYFKLFQESFISQMAYLGTKILLLLWPLLWNKRIKTPFCLKFTPSSLAWGVSTGAFLSTILYISYFLYPQPEALALHVQAKATEFLSLSPIIYLGFSLFLCLAHALLEEYYWRWFVKEGLKQFISSNLSLFLSNMGFAAHHYLILEQFMPLSWSLLGTFGVFVAGVIWALLYQKTRSLSSAWISHMIVDASIMAIGAKLIF